MTKDRADLGHYKGVNLNKILAIPLYASVVSNIFKTIFQSNVFKYNTEESDVLVVYTHARSNRPDYLQIVTNLVKYIGELSVNYIAVNSKFSLSDKLMLIRRLLQSIEMVKVLNGPIWYRLYLVLMIARAKANIDQVYVFLNKANFKVLVSFCDAYDLDNTLAQCANSLGKITVTLQHGQYVILGRDCPENLALTNLVSDYLCAWGEATCSEFSKVDNKVTKVVPLGSLRRYSGGYAEYTEESLSRVESKNVLCLMLNADNHISQNEEMIRIINEFCCSNNMQYVVRFHPKNKKSHYTKLFGVCYLGLFDADKQSVAFSIVYTSGVMVEKLIQGELVFFYQDSISPDVFKKEIIAFNDSRQLQQKVSNIYGNKSSAVRELNQVRGFFVETNNIHERYREFFLNLIPGCEDGAK